jgi:hypothetical protein
MKFSFFLFSFFISLLVLTSFVSSYGVDIPPEQNVNIFLQNVTDLCDLNDTSCISLSNDDILTWDSSSQRWKNNVPTFFRWMLDNIYLYNISNTIYFNETKLNESIDARSANDYEIIWKNNSEQIFIKSGYPDYLNFSDDFFINGSSSRVGIGTSIPTSELEVIGNINLNNTLTILNSTGGNPATFISADRLYYTGKPFDFDDVQVISTNLMAKDSSGLGLYDDGNNLGVFINDSGNVGIGTSTPEESLHVIDGIKQEIKSAPIIKSYIFDLAMTNPYGVFVSGQYAYLTGSTSDSLAIVDISNPTSPSLTGYITNATVLDFPQKVFVSGKYAYVTSSTSDSLSIIDISNPSSPSITGYISNSTIINNPIGLFVSGKYAYVTAYNANSLVIIDISNPSSPSIKGYVSNPSVLGGIHDVIVSGKYAYVTSYNSDSLSIIDISNPSSPSIKGYVSDTSAINGARDVFVSGRYAYVTGSISDSLAIVDISNSSSPYVVSYISNTTLINQAYDVFVSGKYAYVTGASSDSLAIIDIFNASSPSVVSYISNSTLIDNSYSVFVSGKYAYVVSTGLSYLTLIDIHGAELTSLDAGNIKTGSIDVFGSAFFEDGINAKNGITGDNLLIENDASIGKVFNVDSLNGYVGIGKSNPEEKLDVAGNINLNNTLKIFSSISGFASLISADRLYLGGGKVFDLQTSDLLLKRIFANTDDGISFYDNGNNLAIKINDSGLIGINQENPTALLDINYSTTSRASIRIRNGTAPTTPNDGDIWYDDLGLNAFVNNKTKHFTPEEIVYVNSLDDFPPKQADGYIHLADDHYVIHKDIYLIGGFGYKGFYIDSGISPTIEGLRTLYYVDQDYGVADALFKSDDVGDALIILQNLNIFSDGSGRLFKLNASTTDGFIILDTVAVAGFWDLGIIEDISYFAFVVNYIKNLVSGLTLKDNNAIAIQSHRFNDWTNEYGSATFITINGTQQSIQINNNFFQPNGSEKSIYIHPNLTTNGGSVVGNVFDLTQNGSIFQSGSKDQSDIYWTYSGNSNLADSTAIGQTYLNGTLQRTGLVTSDGYVVISSNGSDGWSASPFGEWAIDSDVSERFVVNATAGTITYIGIEDIKIRLSGFVEIEQNVPSGRMRAKFYKNGIEINTTENFGDVSTGSPASINTREYIITMQTNDYLDLRVSTDNALGAKVVDVYFSSKSIAKT